jgi:exopolysaccharide biosynthesis polyprenyl glycosylphosphotransferase
MLKEHSSFVKQAIALLDCILLFAVFRGAHYVVALYRPLSPLLDYWIMFVGFLGFYLYFAWTRQLFSILQFAWMRYIFSRIILIFFLAGILGAAILYLLPDRYNSRTLYMIFASASFIVITTEKYLLRALFSYLRRHNRNIAPVVLFGRGRQAAQIIKKSIAHPEWGLRIIRKIDISVSPAEFEEIIKNLYVDEVFFCLPRSITKGGFKIDPYLQICEEMGRAARVFINISSATNFARWEYHKFMELPTLISHTVELDPDQLFFKRCFDIAGSLVGMLVLFICWPLLAAIIKLTSPGPVFFKQVRVGRNGKRFIIYKFRSMYIDAEERKKELLAHNELSGAVFKIRNDPRVTMIGRIMRALSLDELPQFINVFRGEMSLVGTRPPTPDEVVKYEKWHHRRISVKPGITGLWQVSGRNKITDFDEIVRLDLKYIDMWSIWLDIKIIIKTLAVLFWRDGAY